MKVEIIVITDRSGSMDKIAKDVIGGYNRFLADQKTVPGEARITYTQFDTMYEVIYQGVALEHARDLDERTFQPRGGTALCDAIGRTLNDQGKRIKAEGWADRVIVCIITDGEENSSVEYSQERVKEMIQHAEQHEWHFVFLAANQDAFKTAAAFGMSTVNTHNFTASAAGTAQAYGQTMSSTRSLRADTVPDTSAEVLTK